MPYALDHQQRQRGLSISRYIENEKKYGSLVFNGEDTHKFSHKSQRKNYE
jgi:hypothetical protein